ncbi:PAS domain-containing protein [Alcaligenaceae bacterium CGII-47]|nr:PAS domain-containing protein [Alcaligenaceae bacterium CGII-47]
MEKITDKSAAQKCAEASVKDFSAALGPFVVATQTTRMPMIFTDANAAENPIIFANDSFLTLTGYERDEILAQAFSFLLAHDSEPETLAGITAAFAGDDVCPEAHFRRKDESNFWAVIYVSPVQNQAGKVVEHFVSIVDTTKHKDAQEQYKHLIDELNHRVKNTLSTVQSIVAQTIRTQPEPQAMRDSIESRIFSLSRSHDLLSAMNWRGAWLHDVVDIALTAFGDAGIDASRFIIVRKDPIGLTAPASLVLGIIFHELAANAIKFGALSNDLGTVEIDWAISHSVRGLRLVIRWTELDGPEVLEPTHKGFGTLVIERGLTHELGGETHLDYRTDGLSCTINIPAPLEVLNE